MVKIRIINLKTTFLTFISNWYKLNQTAWSEFQDRKQTQIVTQNEYRVVQKKRPF